MHVARKQFVLGCMLLSGFCAAAAPSIYVHPDAAQLERDAALELQRYWCGAGGGVLPIVAAPAVGPEATGFAIGIGGRIPDVGEAWPFGLDIPQRDGYILHTVGQRVVTIAGVTPEGAQNGVYGLLGALGFGFYLGGDTYPDAVPSFDPGQAPALHESRTPAFAVRGSLPWYNFFNSPTAWELADHQAFIDRLVRMRCNFLGFHTYDSEPFGAYAWDNALVGGEPLVNTSKPTWGTQPLSTEDFLAGTSQYFSGGYFGAASSMIENREEAIRAAQDVLRQSFEYAKRRGLRVCLGFEVTGDPGDPVVQAQFEQRLRTLLENYPMLDYVWLWQPESLGVHPGEQPKPRSLWDGYANRWNEAFSGMAELERRNESTRWGMFALQARQVLAALRPGVRLIVSGWGGDNWLHCTDAFPGFDKVLPGDVIFSALDNIAVTPQVSAAYGQVAPARERWPIVWFEYDGDQWFPQPNLRATAGACSDALAKGCQGLLGIHWRTRGVEESAAFCAQFAWDTSLTVESFCKRRAEDLFGRESADAMASSLVRLQDLGYRWVGGPGQPECGGFSWCAGEEAKRTELEAIGQGLRAELDKRRATPLEGPHAGIDAAHREALEDLVDEITYALDYDHAAAQFIPGAAFDQAVAAGGPAKGADLILSSGFPEALQAYAKRIENKGELGVLATINAKAWADLRKRGGFDEALLTQLEALPAKLEREPSVNVLPDRVIVSGVKPENLTVSVQARPLGAAPAVTQPLAAMGRTTFALAFPADALAAQNFEFGIEVKSGDDVKAVWPAGFPNRWQSAVSFAAIAPSVPQPPVAAPIQAPVPQCAVAPERYAVQLAWEARPGEMYTIGRSGQALGSVADGWFEDAAAQCNTKAVYTVAARNLLSGETAAAEASVDIPDLPLPQPPEQIRLRTRDNRIVLGWDSNASSAVQYFIVKYDTNQTKIEETYIDADYGQYLQMSDLVEGGQAYSYTVAAVAPDGRIGPPSKPVGIVASTDPLVPTVQLSFKDDSHLSGLAQLAENGLALGGRGWAELPPQPEWNPDHALSICAWVKFDDLNGMPVLVCKGTWNQSGYFVQLLNQQIRFHLAGVDTLDAGRPQAGVWQYVVVTFGFNQMNVYLNGEQVGRKRVVGRPRPSENPLLVGRYGAANDDAYFVRGLMDDVRIYLVPLTPDEVAALYKETVHQ